MLRGVITGQSLSNVSSSYTPKNLLRGTMKVRIQEYVVQMDPNAYSHFDPRMAAIRRLWREPLDDLIFHKIPPRTIAESGIEWNQVRILTKARTVGASAPELVGDFHSLDEIEYKIDMNSGMWR